MKSLSREELIDILAKVGVDLPPRTKLPQAELEKRLRRTLDCTQRIHDVLPKTAGSAPRTLTIPSLQRWTSDSKKPLEQALRRDTWEEIVQGFKQRMLTGSGTYQAGSGDLLMDLRYILVNFGHHWEQGRDRFIIQDKEKTSAIAARVIGIYAVDEKTPVVVLLYHDATVGTPDEQRGFDWMMHHVSQPTYAENPFIRPTFPVTSQQLLLRLLLMNSKRLPKTYDVTRQKLESHFKLSFLLPIGPLNVRDSAKMNSNTGCIMCGENASKRCAGCLATYYCSPECQTADWKEHKPTCKTLKGATWTQIRFAYPKLPEKGFTMRWNKRTPVGEMEQVADSNNNEAPENIHGMQPFLVKLQCSSTSAKPFELTGGVMVYDKRRSLDVVYPRPDSDLGGGKLFDEVVERIFREGIGHEKMFFWARRTGDWELSISLDRLPDQTVKW